MTHRKKEEMSPTGGTESIIYQNSFNHLRVLSVWWSFYFVGKAMIKALSWGKNISSFLWVFLWQNRQTVLSVRLWLELIRKGEDIGNALKTYVKCYNWDWNMRNAFVATEFVRKFSRTACREMIPPVSVWKASNCMSSLLWSEPILLLHFAFELWRRPRRACCCTQSCTHACLFQCKLSFRFRSASQRNTDRPLRSPRQFSAGFVQSCPKCLHPLFSPPIRWRSCTLAPCEVPPQSVLFCSRSVVSVRSVSWQLDAVLWCLPIQRRRRLVARWVFLKQIWSARTRRCCLASLVALLLWSVGVCVVGLTISQTRDSVFRLRQQSATNPNTLRPFHVCVSAKHGVLNKLSWFFLLNLGHLFLARITKKPKNKKKKQMKFQKKISWNKKCYLHFSSLLSNVSLFPQKYSLVRCFFRIRWSGVSFCYFSLLHFSFIPKHGHSPKTSQCISNFLTMSWPAANRLANSVLTVPFRTQGHVSKFRQWSNFYLDKLWYFWCLLFWCVCDHAFDCDCMIEICTCCCV